MSYYYQIVGNYLNQDSSGSAPGVSSKPNFYHTATGQEHLRRRQQSATQRQLRGMRSEVLRQGQVVRQGSQVFSPEQIEQRQEVADSYLSTLDALAPLVSSGMIGADAIRSALGESVDDTLTRRRNIQTAAKDFEHIRKGFSTGRFDMGQTTKAMAAFEEEHGNLVYEIPGFAEFAGKGGEYMEARERALQQYAESRGLDRRFVTWDTRTNAPSYNSAEFAVEEKKAEIQDLFARPKLEARKLLAQGLRPDKPRRSDFKSVAGGTDEKAYADAMKDYRQEVSRYAATFGEGALSEEEIASYVQGATVGGQSSTSQQLLELVQPEPIDPQAAQAAVNAGTLPAGAFIAPTGRRYTVTKDL